MISRKYCPCISGSSMVHDHAPVVSCVPYSPGGWFIPLATTQLSGAPAIHVSRQPEIRNVAPGERLGRVVAANVSDSGAVVVGASVVGGVGTEVAVVVGGAVVDDAAAVVVVGGVSSAVVVVVDDASRSPAEAASTWSDELDDSPRLVIAHTPRPPIMIPLTRKTILILSQF